MEGAKWNCEPRCKGALVQRGKMQNTDPHCFERASNDDCCMVVRCENDDVEIISEIGEFSFFFFS
jgi:hypothetical protein